MVENYQIISKKYRPQTFESIVGQEAVVITLQNALRSKKLAHAYLFCGSRGTGKTTFARIFAKALNCANLTEQMQPCNRCASCLDINAGRSLDVLEIDGASNRGIDDIRNLNETIGYAPTFGSYKIYIIDEVHMLTKEAFNALLKTLEEPPKHVKFFFATTEPHKILPTIISRCQRFDLCRIPEQKIVDKLVYITRELQVACEERVLHLIAHLSEGSLRDAESLLDQMICSVEAPISLEKAQAILGLMPKETFFALDHAFETQTLSFACKLVQELFASGKDPAHFLDMLIEHYHNLLHIKLGQSTNIFDSKERQSYQASSLLYTQEQCLYILDYLIHWQQQINKIPFKRIFFEMLLLHILRCKYRLSPATLVKRLVDLEQKFSPTTKQAAFATRVEKQTENNPPKSDLPIKEAQITQLTELSSIEKIEDNLSDLKPNLPIKEAQITQLTELSSIEKIEDSLSNLKPDLSIKEERVTQLVEQPIQPVGKVHHSRYDTLLQFAAIELEGIVKK